MTDRATWTGRQELRQLLAGKQDKFEVYPALLGRVSDQAVAVPGRPGYVFVRIGHDETLGQARNKRVPLRYDLPVLVGYDGITPDFQVLSVRQDEYLDAGFSEVPEVAPHHTTHEWPLPNEQADGSDLVFVHHRQIRNCRVAAGGGFTVVMEGGLFTTTSGWRWSPQQSLNLSAHKPTGGSRYVLLYLDAAGVFTARPGVIREYGEVISAEHIPQANADEFPLAAVLLYDAQTAIRDDRQRQDIVDLRLVGNTGVGEHTIISTAHSDTAGEPADDDVLAYSATLAAWVPRPRAICGGSSNLSQVIARWYADGALDSVTEFDGVFILPYRMRIESVTMYVQDTGNGDAGATTIDVDYSSDGVSWTTLFTDIADRPSLASGSGTKIVSSAPSEVAILNAGALLRASIVAVGSGARGLTVEIIGIYRPGDGATHQVRLPIMWIG